MRKIQLFSLALFSVVALSSCNDAASKIKSADERAETSLVDGQAVPTFDFEQEVYNFGTITEGTVVDTVFHFTNNGEGPLIINSAQGSCGCTVPDWPRQPIAPGESGVINVQFNSQNRGGHNEKTVTIISNAVPKTKVLKFSAEVVPAEGK